MRIYVDASIFLADGTAYGSASGALDLSIAPIIGDTISFLFPRTGAAQARVAGFKGQLRVIERLLQAGISGEAISVMLEDVIAQTPEDARKICDFLEQGFGLRSDIYLR